MRIVRGATLAGLAASARLARLGHEVALVTEGEPLGGHRDATSETITLPSAWRDLFKKSGAHLQTELNRARLTLSEAPPAAQLLTDGTVVELPSDRGGQYRAIAARYGPAEATAWQQLLDDLDEVWMAYRRHALEGNAPVRTQAERSALWLDRSLAEVASRLGSGLSALVPGFADDPAAPALLALPLAVERMFGRWRLVDEAGNPQPASTLIDLLVQRLAERGVRILEHTDQLPDLDCVPPRGWRWPVRSAEEWLAAPPIVGADGALRASAASPAGPEPWAELGSAALAVYELHERLTGEDCRPTNIAFRLPRLP